MNDKLQSSKLQNDKWAKCLIFRPVRINRRPPSHSLPLFPPADAPRCLSYLACTKGQATPPWTMGRSQFRANVTQPLVFSSPPRDALLVRAPHTSPCICTYVIRHTCIRAFAPACKRLGQRLGIRARVLPPRSGSPPRAAAPTLRAYCVPFPRTACGEKHEQHAVRKVHTTHCVCTREGSRSTHGMNIFPRACTYFPCALSNLFHQWVLLRLRSAHTKLSSRTEFAPPQIFVCVMQ